MTETPGVIGLLLVGSAARGEMSENSDWDFVAVIDDGVPWPKPFRDGGRESFQGPDGRQVEINYRTLSSLRGWTEEQAGQGVSAFAEMLGEGSPVGLQSPAVGALQDWARAILESGPPPLASSDLAWRCYEIWNQVKDVEDTLTADEVTSYYLAQAPFWGLTTLLIRLSGTWLPRPKAVFARVRDLDPEFFEIAQSCAVATTAGARYRALSEMMSRLAERFGLDFAAYYTSPPEIRES
ncbi:MAG TPA: nucleotidyltransferase domain-containing protein [Dehalococcoidia bacterium]|nr:nucleotidyltransferase domain-containing protein [Dehalococcoidia bacterium]